jgi:hypothetical protein
MSKDTSSITPSLQYSIAPCSIFFAGFPLASAASRQATEPQGPTAQLQKLAAGEGIKTKYAGMQVDIRLFGKKQTPLRAVGSTEPEANAQS